jgi:diguanylate cyclase (GGDEF)-like protein
VRPSEQDPLTGLGNRALFERLLDTWRPGENADLALILVDLDRFKQVNDTLGHLTGDALLKLVAGRLAAATRSEDRIMRLGGDEFVILQAVRGDLVGARAAAERIVELIGRVFLVGGHQVHVGASVGIAALHHGTERRSDLFQHADLALYAAKAAGGGTVCFFEPALEANARERHALEIELRRALPLKQFVLHYQPQLSLPSGDVFGFEALLRWEHPESGTVPPLNFIPLAEEIGEIHAIGEWVLRTACREAAAWPADLRVAVNVSPVQFEDPTLVDRIRRALADAGLAPTRLEIEITESVLMRHPSSALQRLHEIRALGIGIALDDFGTGYSSLSYLNSFPFSRVKIDKSFVQNDGGDRNAGALVQSIINLGHRLGMTTFAEGVETSDQYQSLLDSGCGGLQGFLVGPPVPGRRIRDYIAGSRNSIGGGRGT